MAVVDSFVALKASTSGRVGPVQVDAASNRSVTAGAVWPWAEGMTGAAVSSRRAMQRASPPRATIRPMGSGAILATGARVACALSPGDEVVQLQDGVEGRDEREEDGDDEAKRPLA